MTLFLIGLIAHTNKKIYMTSNLPVPDKTLTIKSRFRENKTQTSDTSPCSMVNADTFTLRSLHSVLQLHKHSPALEVEIK